MNAKRVLAILIGVGLLVCVAGAWFVWHKVTKLEERGVAISLRDTPSEERRVEMEEAFNEVLDREELISTLVTDCGLVDFYGVASEEEARKLARSRSRAYFYTPKRLFIVHQAKRYERGDNDKIGRRLGELFQEAAFGAPAGGVSGGQ